METLDLHHHYAGGTGFTLDQIPSEVVANFFRYLPNLDMGRMMFICKDFNEILSTNPSLWRIVELGKALSKKRTIKIIEVFASRSKNTLVTIKSPRRFDEQMQGDLLPLLDLNKATLRRLDLNFRCSSGKDKPPLIRFFDSFPNIERLNLTSEDLPEAEEQISGVLTMFALSTFWSNQPWSREDLEKISSVRRIHIEYIDDIDDEGNYATDQPLAQVLQACSPNLIHISIGSLTLFEKPFDFDLPVLSSLELGDSDYWDDVFIGSLPSLKHISASPNALEVLERIIPKKMQALTFMIESGQHFEGVDHYRDSLEIMNGMVKESDSTLVTLKLKRAQMGDTGSFDVDPLLQTLKFDYLLSLPGCPLLSSLYISKEQQYNEALLAEVTVTRNFVSRSSELSWKDDEEDGRCCSLTLYLDASHIDDFRGTEQEVLSRCPKFVRDRVGRTKVRKWDGK